MFQMLVIAVPRNVYIRLHIRQRSAGKVPLIFKSDILVDFPIVRAFLYMHLSLGCEEEERSISSKFQYM